MADLAVRATVRVIDGQAREFRLKDDPSPTVATYFAVAEGKTAGLFELPVVGTAKLAAAPADLIGALGEAARDLGVLFQVQDDLLDLYGDKGRDRRGSDVAEGKISILAARASENAPAEDVRRLRAILAKPREATTAEDVEEAEGIFRRSGAVDFAVAEIGRRERAIAGHPGLARAPRLRALLAGLGDAFLEPIRPVVREFGRR
jgi:geranylgeranyl pyrophosphate synthase